MPLAEPQSGHDPSGAEVLTLAEVAAYLRVPEDAVLEMTGPDALPGQKIGGEWRFLRRAVVEWLRFGSLSRREFGRFPPPWMLDHPFWEDVLHVLEQRILSKLPPPPSVGKPGSKEAVLRHFGVFKDDADLEEQLAAIRAGRQAAGG